MSATKVRPLEFEFRERPYRLRMPFRFGVTTATHGRQAVVRARVRLENGTECDGYAAEALGAKWFDKNLALSDEDNHHQLRRALELAAEMRLGDGAAAPFALFANQYDEHIAACSALGLNALIASYGQSLVDRAIVDALCRGLGVSFYHALQKNLLGIAPHAIIGDLAAFDFDRFLAGLQPLATLDIRHTVGLADPLTEADQDRRIGDGLPETLQEVVDVYRNRYFKVKISGDEGTDLDRLERIATILDAIGEPYIVSLDGNEQYTGQASLAGFLDRIAGSDRLSRFARSILYVEQPIARKNALEEPVRAAAGHWPLIIDESDGEISAFVRARALGYSGVSTKACKGIYKSIVNRARCTAWNGGKEGPHFMSAEDLTCEPGIALQQDLALVSILGLTHVERNAHHFIDGFGGRPDTEARAFHAAHPDLYRDDAGRIRLAISEGAIAITSLDSPGFGTAVVPDVEHTEPMPRSAWPTATGDDA